MLVPFRTCDNVHVAGVKFCSCRVSACVCFWGAWLDCVKVADSFNFLITELLLLPLFTFMFKNMLRLLFRLDSIVGFISKTSLSWCNLWHLKSMLSLKRLQEVYCIALVLWSAVMCTLPSLKLKCAPQSWPSRQLVAGLLYWTVTLSSHKPAEDTKEEAGSRGWLFMPSDKNNKVPASCRLQQWLRRWCKHRLKTHRVILWGQAKTDNSEGKVVKWRPGLQMKKGLWTTLTIKFHFFFFCMHKRQVW